MWVRDHARKDFHNALGVDIDWYDQEVFRKTSAIARQVFPIEIDIDHPRWIPGLRRMNAAMLDMERGQKAGGVAGWIKHKTATARAMLAFAGLYLIPVKHQTPPANVQLEPSY
jgi:magnesium-protoporphyrin IX monomethyl ester (oxidative) cyclase